MGKTFKKKRQTQWTKIKEFQININYFPQLKTQLIHNNKKRQEVVTNGPAYLANNET